MDIEFNINRRTDQVENQPVKRQAAVNSAAETPALSSSQSLERSIKDLPQVRPEQVARARALVADTKYPPDEMMKRIASLLAMHVNQ